MTPKAQRYQDDINEIFSDDIDIDPEELEVAVERAIDDYLSKHPEAT